MAKDRDYQHSILIVSSSEQFHVIVKRSLKNFITIDSKKSGVLARRALLERDYDLIVIDAPLSDEMGQELALDLSEKGSASILIVAPKEISEDIMESVTDQGILVVPKPFPKGRVDKAIRFLVAMQKRFRHYEKKSLSVEEKMEEIKLVSRAKILLVEKKHMSEEDAHRFIGKQAMDHGLPRRVTAQKIIDALDAS
ncbi:MAG: ANTAR domain-containing protein [Lachnospiraceae bacterium]|nr:ANTAR domain-containing protein [Lachnospiraceae bacterium]